MNLWNQLEQLQKMTWIDLSHEFGEKMCIRDRAKLGKAA